MNPLIVPVILCGGSGSRLWPASREAYPKQLLSFGNTGSLFQQTIARVTGPEFAPPVIISNNDYRFLVAEQMQSVSCKGDLILEPARRDSCAAIAAAAIYVMARDADAVLLVLAADHAIADTAHFVDHVLRGRMAAESGHLVTFGVTPTSPSTSYGYIRPGPALPDMAGINRIDAFVEKPDRAKAQHYIEAGYLWNTGNFLFTAQAFLRELKAYQPVIFETVSRSVQSATRDLDFIRLDSASFMEAPSISVDYAIMQETKSAAVIQSDFNWSDVGSWDMIWQLSEKDEYNNSIEGNVVLHNTNNSYVRSQNILTTVVGLNDVIVITTRDAVLVTSQGKSEELKGLVAKLVKNNHSEARDHVRVYRPWGDYEQIDKGARYQVKRITVKPNGKISLQSHKHRSEHWVVVSGSAHISVDGVDKKLEENESIYIPLGSIHRLYNPGPDKLELIEVQSGDYLGEDDIIRYEDIYNRV